MIILMIIIIVRIILLVTEIITFSVKTASYARVVASSALSY